MRARRVTSILLPSRCSPATIKLRVPSIFSFKVAKGRTAMLCGRFSCSWAQNKHKFEPGVSYALRVLSPSWLQTIGWISGCRGVQKCHNLSRKNLLKYNRYDGDRVSFVWRSRPLTASAWGMSLAHLRVWLMPTVLRPPSCHPNRRIHQAREADRLHDRCPNRCSYKLPRLFY